MEGQRRQLRSREGPKRLEVAEEQEPAEGQDDIQLGNGPGGCGDVKMWRCGDVKMWGKKIEGRRIWEVNCVTGD